MNYRIDLAVLSEKSCGCCSVLLWFNAWHRCWNSRMVRSVAEITEHVSWARLFRSSDIIRICNASSHDGFHVLARSRAGSHECVAIGEDRLFVFPRVSQCPGHAGYFNGEWCAYQDGGFSSRTDFVSLVPDPL